MENLIINKMKLKNRRGSIIDIAFLLIGILGLGILLLIIGYVFPQITGQIKATEGIGNDTGAVAALDYTDSLMGRLDGIFLIIYIGLAISVLITSFFIDSSPIIIPIYIIALLLMVGFAVIAENIYSAFSESATFATVSATHPITGYILNHLWVTTIAIGVLSMILIFAKPKNAGGGYG